MSAYARLRSSLVLLALALVSQAARPISVAAAPANQSTTLSVCGVVSQYTAATTSANGTITIGGTRFTILKNANPATIFTGSAAGQLTTTNPNLCFQLTLSAGQISSGVVTANTPSTATVCGTVTAYMPSAAPTSTSPGTVGSITIKTAAGTSQTFAIAPGATATNLAGTPIAVNANLCFQFALNGLNQVTRATVFANTTGTGTGLSRICGLVTAYQAAGTTTTGSITVAGQTLKIAAGVVPTGVTITTPGNFCITFTLNASGQLATLSVAAGLSGVSFVCGAFLTFTPASGTTAASLMLAGGLVFPVNTTMFAATSLVAGQSFCLLLSNGVVVGMLSLVPTAATPAAAAPNGRYRVGRIWAE